MGTDAGSTPATLVVYAVEGRTFALGAGLSPEVERAVREVVARVVDEVNNQRSTFHPH